MTGALRLDPGQLKYYTSCLGVMGALRLDRAVIRDSDLLILMIIGKMKNVKIMPFGQVANFDLVHRELIHSKYVKTCGVMSVVTWRD